MRLVDRVSAVCTTGVGPERTRPQIVDVPVPLQRQEKEIMKLLQISPEQLVQRSAKKQIMNVPVRQFHDETVEGDLGFSAIILDLPFYFRPPRRA